METSPEQEIKNVQDIRNKIDYDRSSSYEKCAFLSCKQRHLQLLYIDSLASVYSRRYYGEHFRGSDDIQMMAVIDVGNSKYINDNHGHDIGDIVLQSIVQAILSCVRKTNTVVCYSGGEPITILFDIPQDISGEKPERIRYSVDDLIIDDHPELRMSVSISGAHGTGTMKKLFKAVDNMMYQSEKAENQVTIYYFDRNKDNTDNT